MDWSKMLVTGGIFAMIAAGWNQVRATFSYVSRFLIVRASVIDESSAMAVMEYLKVNWSQAPDGLSTYTGMWQKLKGHSTQTLVPFKVLNSTSIWYLRSSGRFWFVFVKCTNTAVSLSSVRGFISFDELLKSALKLWAERRSSALAAQRPDRHYLAIIMGAEKNASAAMSNGGLSGRQHTREVEKDSAAPMGNGYYIGSCPNLDYDTPLLYRREDFHQSETQDPFEPLYYSDNVLRVVDDCQQWLDSAEWYLSRSIPWRRGVLLHGPGGTGKSSLALATARKLKIPMYQFFLATMSDQEFINEWQTMHAPCAVLFEEFDTVFNGREPQTEHKSLTFDCVLNMLSGVSNIDGVLLFVTTNHIEKLDAALGVSTIKQDNDTDVAISTRPGRIDQVVYLGSATRECRMHIAQRCLADWPEEILPMVDEYENLTPVQFQEHCVRHALQRRRAESQTAAYIQEGS